MPKCRLCKQEKQIDQITLTHPEEKEYTCHFCIKHIPRKSKKKRRENNSENIILNDPPTIWDLETARTRISTNVAARMRQYAEFTATEPPEAGQDVPEEPVVEVPAAVLRRPHRWTPPLHNTLCNCLLCQRQRG